MLETGTILILLGAFGGYLFGRIKDGEKLASKTEKALETALAQIDRLNERVYDLEKKAGIVTDVSRRLGRSE